MSKQKTLLLMILLIATIVRFINLMWGDGYYFHPDENNMARSISQMSISNSLYPDFFAYGQLPLYMAYFSGVFTNVLYGVLQIIRAIYTHSSIETTALDAVSFEKAIFWLRFYSAFASVGSIYIAYKIAKTIMSRTYTYIAIILTSFTPGLIQAAHFGTTESILTFLFLIILYKCIQLVQNKSDIPSSSHMFVLLGIVFGLSVGIKLTAVYAIVPISIAILFSLRHIQAQKFRRKSLHAIFCFLLFIVSSLIGYSISSPYNLITYQKYIESMTYEIGVGNGLDVFYTRQFIDTTPVLFHLTNIFPYALGWPLFVIGLASCIYALYKIIMYSFTTHSAKDSQKITVLTFILISLLSFFIPTSMLYVKWTRFLTPIFPLFSLLAAYLLSVIIPQIYSRLHKNYKSQSVLTSFTLSIIVVGFIFPGLLFAGLYARSDSRMSASEWIYTHIPKGSYILSETANVVDIPVTIEKSADEIINTHTYDYTVISFNFYELDIDPRLSKELTRHLTEADYIFIPSRRIFYNYLRFPERYPLVNTYYNALFNGMLGFELVHTEIPRSFFPLHDEHAEETWTVFDHPTIRVYKKTTIKTREEYDKILTQSVSL